MRLFAQLLINGIVTGALYALLAVGFGIVYRTTRVFHIAYGGVYVVATYLLYTQVQLLGLPLLLAAPLTVVLTGLFGILLERGVYYRFWRRRAGSGVVLVASLGVFVVIENALALCFGNETHVLGCETGSPMEVAGLVLTRIQLAQLCTGLLILGGLRAAFSRSVAAKALWAMGDEPELVSVLGLRVSRMRSLAFFLSSSLVAIPAALTSLDVGLEPHAGLGHLLIAAVAVLFGGVDKFDGWISGALALALFQAAATWKLPTRSVELVTFGLLVFVLLLRPQGLLGTRRRMEEFTA